MKFDEMHIFPVPLATLPCLRASNQQTTPPRYVAPAAEDAEATKFELGFEFGALRQSVSRCRRSVPIQSVNVGPSGRVVCERARVCVCLFVCVCVCQPVDDCWKRLGSDSKIQT